MVENVFSCLCILNKFMLYLYYFNDYKSATFILYVFMNTHHNIALVRLLTSEQKVIHLIPVGGTWKDIFPSTYYLVSLTD